MAVVARGTILKPAAASADDTAARLARLLSHWLPAPPQALAGLIAYASPRRFTAGELLLAAGAPVDDLVLLETGVVRAFHLLRDKEVNLRLLSAPAAALAYHRHLRHEPADETLQALTPVAGLHALFHLVEWATHGLPRQATLLVAEILAAVVPGLLALLLTAR